jgi:hypothetical protein
MTLIDHGTTPVHDMQHRPAWLLHEVSIPRPVSTARHTALYQDGWRYSCGWVNRQTGTAYDVYTRKEQGPHPADCRTCSQTT